ncbi:MAG: PilZ domain-containing protein [Gemmatimonadota bacterium]|nr:PilZ domain-containing protein [Gemmatimonadota bacterium]
MTDKELKERPVRVRFPAEVEFSGERFKVQEFTANLSIGGIFLPTEYAIPPGTHGTLTFRISQWDNPFTLEAQVVHIFPPGNETYDQRPGVGIQFLNMTKTDQERLQRLVEGVVDGSIAEAIRRAIREEGTDMERELRKRPTDQKMILAFQARAEEIDAVIRDGNPVVILRLMENPRLKIPHIRSIARNTRMTPTIMLAVRKNDEWMKDEETKYLFCKHPRSPIQEVQTVIPTLPRHRLQKLVQDPNLQPLVRKKIEAILGPVYSSW